MARGEGCKAKVQGLALARKPLPLVNWMGGVECGVAAGAGSEVTTG